MSENMDRTLIIQNSIPTRYDPQVTVKPCEPSRVPDLPLDIIYEIAKALPQPKQVFNLAMASKATWEYLQPALYECEVTYEARLTSKYGDKSSTSLHKYYEKYIGNDERGSVTEDEEDATSSADQSRDFTGSRCQGDSTAGYECDGRISLEDRVFNTKFPDGERFDVNGALTALHWASMEGASALPVAQRAIRSALAHQPSYIDGLNLKVRYFCAGRCPDGRPRFFPADVPPPLFLAVAHGNTAVLKALIDAGCDLGLSRGPETCSTHTRRGVEKRLMSYKIHRECVEGKRGTEDCLCVCEWTPRSNLSWAWPCQTAGQLAIEYGQIEMLDMLLRGGLNPRRGFLPLIHYAVLIGKIAAVKTLLDHDPSLIHSRMDGGTVLHTVCFMHQADDDRDIPEGQLRDMVSCLLERGADLEARKDIRTNYMGEGFGDLTPLQVALDFVDGAALDDHVLTALHAAEAFISMGADWDQELDSLDFEGPILDFCVKKTVELMHTQLFDLGYDDATLDNQYKYLGFRKVYGKVVKTIVEKATEDESALKMETYKAAFSNAFSRLTRCRFSGPFSTEAIGQLLLSTGITPSDEDVLRWKARVLESGDAWTESDGEASAESDGYLSERDEDWSDSEEDCSNSDDLSSNESESSEEQEEDGDKSEWAFLLAGIDDEKLVKVE